MRLLLDECVPKRLKDDLLGHDVRHVVEMGWSSRRNGELLRLMVAEHFEVLLTVDQHLEFQQNVQASGIGVVVVRAPRTRLKELRPLVPEILEALSKILTGELIRLELVANSAAADKHTRVAIVVSADCGRSLAELASARTSG